MIDPNSTAELTPILHGTLGSVAQESRVLPAPLLALRRSFTRTLHAYADGSIDRTSVSLRLAALTCVDGAEQIWTIGASTGRWYRRSAQARTWTPADPAHWIDVQPHEQGDSEMPEVPASVAPVGPEGLPRSRGYGALEDDGPSRLLPVIRSDWYPQG